MEYSGRHISTDRLEEIFRTVEEPDREIYAKILANWDATAKPLDGLGRFEEILARIGAILGTEEPDIRKKAVIIMCADNGIVEEGVSQSGMEVTTAVARQMARGNSSVGKMAAVIGADTIPVDIGMYHPEPIKGVWNRKIRRGTGNFRREPAMTREEALEAILTGMEIAADCKEKGYGILAAGEMGIGNTTTSSAVAAALLKCETEAVTGRGAGLNDEKFRNKQRIIAEAVEKYRLYEADPLTALETVGGLDIAGLAGLCIGGALSHIPVVLDGVISMTA
ncbi:MAG: nicotinate-nucleotide--dimethylbenzimidazole phosphoribosyltransferase, partial [Bacteroides sp.]|nr:nicotinate-nucleotide--dimethylbenzimidazole phosphoribosyltransferase [Bacteroides sp.]